MPKPAHIQLAYQSLPSLEEAVCILLAARVGLFPGRQQRAYWKRPIANHASRLWYGFWLSGAFGTSISYAVALIAARVFSKNTKLHYQKLLKLLPSPIQRRRA